MTITKWYTISEYVDINTGEIIDKKIAMKKYIKIKTIKKTEINENIGIIKYITECKENGQTKLFE
jgi:hypothetical protein